jgi:hypothetical protein
MPVIAIPRKTTMKLGAIPRRKYPTDKERRLAVSITDILSRHTSAIIPAGMFMAEEKIVREVPSKPT